MIIYKVSLSIENCTQLSFVFLFAFTLYDNNSGQHHRRTFSKQKLFTGCLMVLTKLSFNNLNYKKSNELNLPLSGFLTKKKKNPLKTHFPTKTTPTGAPH